MTAAISMVATAVPMTQFRLVAGTMFTFSLAENLETKAG